MKTSLRFTAFEMAMQRPYLKTHLVPLVLVVAIIVGINPGPLGALSLCAALAMLAPSSAFSLDERAHLDTLYSVLPFSRKQVVLGRYVSMLSFAAALGVLGITLSVALEFIRSQPVDATELLVIVCTSFLAMSLVLGIQLPVYFALGHSKARIINYAILIAFFGAVWLVFPAIRLDLDSITTAVSSPIFYATTLIGGALVLLTSVLLAIRAYQNRAL